MARALYWMLLAIGEAVALVIARYSLGHLVSHGHFLLPPDIACFRDHAGIIFHHTSPGMTMDSCAFMYPPPFVLLIAALPWLSPLRAYAAWGIAGTAGLFGAARCLDLSRCSILLGFVAPPTIVAIMSGQNGMFVSALLLISIGLARKNPVPAGIAAGCMVIKPHLAILLPICYLADRNWRAILAAAATGFGLLAVSAWVLGVRVWRDLILNGRATAIVMLQTPWPQPLQKNMVSVFMTARSLHAGMPAAVAVQLCMTVVAGFAAWKLWSRADQPDALKNLALTLCLLTIATPYAYISDLPALALALAAYGLSGESARLLAPAAFWILIGFNGFIAMWWCLPGGIGIPLIAAVIWQQHAKGQNAA